MNQIDDKPVTETQTEEKKQSNFVKIGFVIAVVHTLINAIGIWGERPSAYLNSSGATGETALTVYRLSRLFGAAIVNLILWITVALVVMLVLRQLKKRKGGITQG